MGLQNKPFVIILKFTFLSEVSKTTLNTYVRSFKYIKRETRGQMAFATILQVIRFLNSTFNSSFSRELRATDTGLTLNILCGHQTADSRQCCLSIVIRITSAPEKVTACRYIFVFLKLLRQILPSYMQDRMILFQFSPYFIAS